MVGKIGGPEIYFAKKLANNDLKVRKRALKKLKVWLFNRTKIENGLSEADLLKIWKGLFYCMWFSDSYLVQEALANDLANIIHLFKDQEIGLNFSKTFFDEIGREWLGIDRLRLDKFYLLIKNVLRETLKYIGLGGWDSNIVALFVSNLERDFLSSTYPEGVKIFLSEKFIEQLADIIQTEKELNFPKTSQILDLLQPFFNYFLKCKCESVGITIEEEILSPLITLKLSKLKGNDGKNKKLALPFDEISQYLFNVASNKDVSTKHRKMLFSFAEKFQSGGKKIETKKSRKRKLKPANDDKKNTPDNNSEKSLKKKKSSKKIKKSEAKQGNSNLNLGIEENNLEDPNGIEEKNLDLDKSIDFQIISENQVNDEVTETNILGKLKGETNILDSAEPSLKVGKVVTTKLPKNNIKTKKKQKLLEIQVNGAADTNILEKLEKKIAETNTLDSAQPLLKVEKDNNIKTKQKQKRMVKKQKDLKIEGKDINEKLSNGAEAPMEFLKLTPTASFFRKAKRKASSENKVTTKPRKKSLSKSEQKPRVKIELSKNKSISHKDLKLCIANSPLPPFSPNKKPVKSALKTPSKYGTPRSKALDFF